MERKKRGGVDLKSRRRTRVGAPPPRSPSGAAVAGSTACSPNANAASEVAVNRCSRRFHLPLVRRGCRRRDRCEASQPPVPLPARLTRTPPPRSPLRVAAAGSTTCTPDACHPDVKPSCPSTRRPPVLLTSQRHPAPPPWAPLPEPPFRLVFTLDQTGASPPRRHAHVASPPAFALPLPCCRLACVPSAVSPGRRCQACRRENTLALISGSSTPTTLRRPGRADARRQLFDRLRSLRS